MNKPDFFFKFQTKQILYFWLTGGLNCAHSIIIAIALMQACLAKPLPTAPGVHI